MQAERWRREGEGFGRERGRCESMEGRGGESLSGSWREWQDDTPGRLAGQGGKTEMLGRQKREWG